MNETAAADAAAPGVERANACSWLMALVWLALFGLVISIELFGDSESLCWLKCCSYWC